MPQLRQVTALLRDAGAPPKLKNGTFCGESQLPWANHTTGMIGTIEEDNCSYTRTHRARNGNRIEVLLGSLEDVPQSRLVHRKCEIALEQETTRGRAHDYFVIVLFIHSRTGPPGLLIVP